MSLFLSGSCYALWNMALVQTRTSILDIAPHRKATFRWSKNKNMTPIPNSHCVTLVNIDPNVVHKNSSFLSPQSLRSAELFSCYLTPFGPPAISEGVGFIGNADKNFYAVDLKT